MENNNFDYQGKRPEQVEASNKILIICIVGCIVGAMIYGAVKLIIWIV